MIWAYIAIAFLTWMYAAKAIYKHMDDGDPMDIFVAVFFGLIVGALFPISIPFMLIMAYFKKYIINK